MRQCWKSSREGTDTRKKNVLVVSFVVHLTESCYASAMEDLENTHDIILIRMVPHWNSCQGYKEPPFIPPIFTAPNRTSPHIPHTSQQIYQEVTLATINTRHRTEDVYVNVKTSNQLARNVERSITEKHHRSLPVRNICHGIVRGNENMQ